MVGNSGMGLEEEKKKLNDDLVESIGKRAGVEVPTLASRLRSYVDLQYKRHRAEAARRRYHEKKADGDPKDKTMDNTDQLGNEHDSVRKRHGRLKAAPRERSGSRSEEPSDGCCRRKRRRRRRRRSCRRRKRRRRRRRRRSCGRRRRRRRRRSCSRRRRRRSCGRRRRRRRRRRRC